MDQVLFRTLLLYIGSLMLRSLCIAAMAGACTLRIRNVAVRHAIWVAVLIAILAMPIADSMLPSSWIPTRVERIAVEKIQVMQVAVVETVSHRAVPSPAVSIPVPHKAFPWWSIALALYAFVGMALAVRLGLAYRSVTRLVRASHPVASVLRDEIADAHGLRWRIPQLRESNAVRVPITIGFLRPVVLLPPGWDTWDEFQMRAVLGHEFAHVRRGDWATAAVAAFNKCVFWLNPLSGFLERHLSELAERACDDAALNITKDAARYAEVLLQFAAAHDGHRLLTGGVAMARHNMRSRIERVLEMKRPGSGVLKLAGWSLVLTLAVPVLYAAAAIQVSSDAAPAPSYTQLIAQLPLPRVPQQAEQAPGQSRVIEAQKQFETVPAADQKTQLENAIDQSRELERALNIAQKQYVDVLAQVQSRNSAGAASQEQLQAAIAQSRELERALNSLQSQLLATRSQVQSNAIPASVLQDQTQRAIDQSRELVKELNSLQARLLAMRVQAQAKPSLAAPKSPELSVRDARELTNKFAQTFNELTRAQELQDLQKAEVRSRTPDAVPATGPLPKVITKVEPVYPSALRTAGVEGTVLLLVTIGPDGHVIEIKATSSTNPLFTNSAIEAVRQWVFEPTLVGGKPAATTVEVPVDFKLQPQAQRDPRYAGLIESAANSALLNLPDNDDDLRAYLTQLAELRLRGTNPGSAGLASVAVASTPNPFSFTLTTDQKGKYTMQIGGFSYAYECYGVQNCQFLMSGSNYQRMTNVNSSDYGVHVAANQGPKMNDFVLTCEAKECVITSVENGKSLKRTLKSNEATTISEAAKISGVVN